jgi:hypothetical protein
MLRHAYGTPSPTRGMAPGRSRVDQGCDGGEDLPERLQRLRKADLRLSAHFAFNNWANCARGANGPRCLRFDWTLYDT